MGASQLPLPVSHDLKDMVRGNEEKRNISTGSLSNKRKLQGIGRQRRKRARMMFMQRRARLEGSRRPGKGVERRVKVLKKLIPNGQSMGLDGLFRETADYILSLKMRVQVMQIMVKALTCSDE